MNFLKAAIATKLKILSAVQCALLLITRGVELPSAGCKLRQERGMRIMLRQIW